MHLEAGAFDVDGELTLKLELLQHTGSFKPRGAFNRLLSADVPPVGVIAASGGNFGLAVAYAARETGHPAEIFVPSSSPAVKAERIRAEGAEVRVVPGFYSDALEASRQRARESGALFMHAYDQPEVVAGQGTIGMELSEQVPDAVTVLVAVGGGGLIAGSRRGSQDGSASSGSSHAAAPPSPKLCAPALRSTSRWAAWRRTPWARAARASSPSIPLGDSSKRSCSSRTMRSPRRNGRSGARAA